MQHMCRANGLLIQPVYWLLVLSSIVIVPFIFFLLATVARIVTFLTSSNADVYTGTIYVLRV